MKSDYIRFIKLVNGFELYFELSIECIIQSNNKNLNRPLKL